MDYVKTYTYIILHTPFFINITDITYNYISINNKFLIL